MIRELREECRHLLEEGLVDLVIGYGERSPVIVTSADQVERLQWHERCVWNLTVYLKRKEIKAAGKPAIFLKPVDERALNVLIQESQVRPEDIHILRVPDLPAPAAKAEPASPGANGATRWEFWKSEFARCIKCYACRQVCPLCYCERCIVDKNRPTVIDTSASLKGNFAWHITRAFHLAARCVDCGECTRVCPAGIDLRRLNRTLAAAAREHFHYEAGKDPGAQPVIGAWSARDKEDFIR